jgi:hypothetical protein
MQSNEVVDQGKWGICGFVAVLNALHQAGTLKEFGRNLTLEDIRNRLGAELVTFLKIIEQENQDIAKEIVVFTNSFGPPYNTYDRIDKFITKIEEDLRKAPKDTEKIIDQGPKFGIAMTANAVKLYLEKFANFSIQEKQFSGSFNANNLPTYKNCVIGLGTDGQLKHWVYMDKGGHLYNWGKKGDLTALGRYNCINSIFEIQGTKSKK